MKVCGKLHLVYVMFWCEHKELRLSIHVCILSCFSRPASHCLLPQTCKTRHHVLHFLSTNYLRYWYLLSSSKESKKSSKPELEGSNPIWRTFTYNMFSANSDVDVSIIDKLNKWKVNPVNNTIINTQSASTSPASHTAENSLKASISSEIKTQLSAMFSTSPTQNNVNRDTNFLCLLSKKKFVCNCQISSQM